MTRHTSSRNIMCVRCIGQGESVPLSSCEIDDSTMHFTMVERCHKQEMDGSNCDSECEAAIYPNALGT